MKIATGQSAYSNEIKNRTVTCKQLFNKLKKPVIRKKKDGPYFVFAEFKGNTRNAQNVIAYHGATIDLDDTPLSILEIREAFSDFRYAIHTTYSHRLPDKGDRYRLILPYKNPLPPEQHRQVMFYIMDRLGIENVDLSSHAISRPMYLPACPRGHEKDFQCIIKPRGKMFEVELTDELLFELKERQADPENQTAFDINSEISEGDRNNQLSRLAGKLINTGMDASAIHRTAQTWNETNCSPPLSSKDVKTIVNSILKAHTRNSDKWGHDEIAQRIKDNIDFETATKLIANGKLTKSEKEILTRTLARKAKLPLGTTRDAIKEKEIKGKEIEEDADEENQQLTAKQLRKKFKNWIYISSIDRVYNYTKKLKFKPDGFNRAHSSLVEKGTVLGLLLKYHCIKTADILEFHPGEGQLYKSGPVVCANTYRPPDIFPIPGSVRPMLRHMKKLIPKKEERNIILDYIAFLIQNPGVKIHWMPIIKGRKGIGKSIIIDYIIRPLLGSKNVRNVKAKKIHSEFNAWQLDTQLVAFHELKIGETRKEKLSLTDDLKETITDGVEMTASYKGIDDYQTPNRVNLFALTNHEDAIMITVDERRFFMVLSTMAPMPREYYTDLVKWLTTHLEEMYYFFETRDITNFNYQVAPENNYTNEVKSLSFMWPTSVIAEALSDKKSFLSTDGFTTWSGVVEYIRHESVGKDAMEADSLIKPTSSSGYKLINALKDLGFQKWTNDSGLSRIRINGRLETVFICPHNKNPENYNLSDIRKMLSNQCKLWDFEDEG